MPKIHVNSSERSVARMDVIVFFYGDAAILLFARLAQLRGSFSIFIIAIVFYPQAGHRAETLVILPLGAGQPRSFPQK